ncbi:hypothetical protein SAMN04515668_0535 [Hymenobacter arizonensis]|uniref:Uncharacterized protein n=1 Tax=Hymenobacter arizonensis TaxID=1227077 RepID=A0A1I5TMV4_HYMAR|nr:hypothetical protein SAMN04515668_0535 [Hymenobacter arizonensis]
MIFIELNIKELWYLIIENTFIFKYLITNNYCLIKKVKTSCGILY